MDIIAARLEDVTKPSSTPDRFGFGSDKFDMEQRKQKALMLQEQRRQARSSPV